MSFLKFLSLLVGGICFSVTVSVALILFYFHQFHPQEFQYYEASLQRDVEFAEKWVSYFASGEAEWRCELLGLPQGYRCFYYQTFREFEVKAFSLPGFFWLWSQGLAMIWHADPILALQDKVESGVPSEDNKLLQIRHWTFFFFREAWRAVPQSPPLVSLKSDISSLFGGGS